MAKKTKKDAEDAGAAAKEEKDGGKKKRGGVMPALIIALAVLGGGAMAGGIVGGGAGDAEAAPTPEETETAPPELGMITQLESLTLNLADGHFLKLGIAVEWGEEVAEEPQTAPIYDMVIARFSALDSESLSAVASRDDAKEMLLADLATVYGEDVVRLYFTEFVMQ